MDNNSSEQKVFSSSMEIPGTMFYLNKKAMYNPGSRDRAKASKVSSGSSSFGQSFAGLTGWVFWIAYRRSDWHKSAIEL